MKFLCILFIQRLGFGGKAVAPFHILLVIIRCISINLISRQELPFLFSIVTTSKLNYLVKYAQNMCT